MELHPWVYRRFCETGHSSWSDHQLVATQSRENQIVSQQRLKRRLIRWIILKKKKDQNRPQQNGWKLAEETIHSDLFVMPLVNRRVRGQKTPRFETPPGVFAGFPPPIWPLMGESGSQKDSQQVWSQSRDTGCSMGASWDIRIDQHTILILWKAMFQIPKNCLK